MKFYSYAWLNFDKYSKFFMHILNVVENKKYIPVVYNCTAIKIWSTAIMRAV